MKADHHASRRQRRGACRLGALLMLSVQYRLSREQRISEKPLAIAEGESGA